MFKTRDTTLHTTLPVLLLWVMSAALAGQTEKQTQAGKALQIAWGDGNTISITVPLEGKHAVHVHPIKSAKESRYTAVRAEVTRQGNIATVQISGIFGTIKEFTCKAIGEMPQDRLGTYSLSLDKNDSVRIQDFENQGIKAFEIRVGDAEAPCPKPNPGCCTCSHGGTCLECCAKTECITCGACGLCCG